MPKPWLYVTDSKLSGIGIDMVTEQQLMALSEAEIPVDLVARGKSNLPSVKQFRSTGYPPDQAALLAAVSGLLRAQQALFFSSRSPLF